MRKTFLFLLLVVAVLGCGKTHPAKVYVAPAYNPADIEKIAVLPFASSLHHSDDPDGRAPATMDGLFREELDTRDDYSFLSPRSVAYAIDGAGLSDELERFVDNFRKSGDVDVEFLQKCHHTLQAEALLIGVVDLWNQDEVDYRETSATPSTTVGATVTIFSLIDGSKLFEASDEDFLEGIQSEAGDRAVRTSALGTVRSDPGRNVYEAPDPKDVALKVVRALVSSIPVR